ncbi:hypothetical protein H4R26_000723 [Coemansia thaxteri]|uniref:Uncharacterized protein n=1 Tax=Coemansia thaxteri TaxID=2663907 RepID=A0A9W8BND2_9FUNG|nr:hypothetical protein H4R26_000723 [Coemansia thaxteri]
MTGSESTNASAPVSPVAAVEPRLSFDGETISPSETASISALAVHGSGLRSVHKRATQPFGALRRPNSVASAYLDSGKGTHSRSEVSLSREQVVWSPQIGYGASESTFGFSSLDTMSMSPPLVMAGVGNFSEDSGVDRRCDIEGAFISRDEHTNFISAALATTDGDLVNNLSQINSAASDSAAHSESDCHFNNDFLEGKSPGSSLGRAASRVSSEYVRHSPHNISSPASAKSLRVPPLHRGGSMMSAASPRSLPRGLSLRSASSLTSSPSASSMASPTTPLGSPSIHIATNPLSVITMPEMSPVMGRQSAVSPQFPSEATRMLKRAIMEKPRKDSAETSPLASRTTSHTPTSDRAHHALVSIGAEADSENDVAAAVSDMKAAFSHGSRSRALSIAHSLKCALEEGEPVIQLQSGCLPKPDSEALPPSSDLVRGFCPSSRTNPERMSTWSSSSARTLADGMCGMRVPSMDDSRAGAKHTLPSAALYSLSASAAIVNQPLTHGDAASRGLNSSAASSVAARSVRGRPAADLGLSIRSDLERRVRSFSASEGGHSLPGGTRPHSSMGFHKPAAGARSSMWSTQSGSFRARRLSPHSNSMRFFRSENSAPHPHRLSVMSTGSNSRSARLASVPLDLEEHPSDAASIGSFSSQTTEMQLPSPPTSESQSQVVSPADAPAGKRRAQTMDQPLNVH